MRVLITGGCGFIGSVLCRLLSDKKQHDITVVDNGSRSMSRPPDGVRYLLHDVRLMTAREFSDLAPDVVVHLAARCSLPEGEVEREDYLVTNVFGTFMLTGALARSGCPAHFVYAGSSAQASTVGGSSASWYGWTKDVAEQSARRLLKESRFTCLKLFNVAGSAYGVRESPGPYGRLIPNVVNTIRNGIPFKLRGNGATVRDFVHVLDVARAFELAAEKRTPGTFEIGSGKGHTVLEVARKVAATMRRPVEFLDDGALAYAEAAATVANVRGAKEALGWEPQKTLDDCIRDVASN